jgi:predicted phage gp36 major capsid-like protein
VVQIATDSWNGVTSAGVTAHWLDEAAEVSDDSPSLAQPHIPGSDSANDNAFRMLVA